MAESPRSWIVGCIRQRDGASIAKSPRQSDCRLRPQACPGVPLKPKWTARMMAAPVGVPGCSVLDERTARVTVVSVNESGALDLDLPTTRRTHP